MLSVARGLTFIFNDGMPIAGLSPSFKFIGQGVVAGVPVPVLILAATFLLFWFILKYTTFGRYVYAVGGTTTSSSAW